MLNEKALKYIQVNRDAIAVNRGFYYQFLHVLKKWINHYIDGNDVSIFTEVDDDIKEVGGKLVFTQVKSYTETFSLRSKAVQNSLFNFYTLYLDAGLAGNGELAFHFQTNTAISPKETLLQSWVSGQANLGEPLQSDVTKKVRDIIGSILKKKRDSLLAGSDISEIQRDQIKTAFSSLNDQLSKREFVNFTRSIRWTFLDKAPELAVEELYQEILTLLQHDCFDHKPIHILIEVFLSEIYRCSQLADPAQRIVDRRLMSAILSRKTAELNEYFNQQFLDLLDARFSFVYQSLLALQTEVKGIKSQLAESPRQSSAIPKELTLLPFVNNLQTIERTVEMEALTAIINTSRHTCLTGVGGMGKTVIGKLYIQHHAKAYDHVIWLDCTDSFSKALLYNEGLINNLNISVARESNERLIKEVLNKLNHLPGNNFIVLDDFNEESLLPELQSLSNWKLLITTRKRFPAIANFEMAAWDLEQAKTIYRFYEPQQPNSDDDFRTFFEQVEYNPLVIALGAKTIRNSADLDLIQLTEMIKGQALDDIELDIDIKVEGEGNTRLLKVLQKTFDVTLLKSEESYFMMFLAVLPKDILISDLVLWYGKKDAKGNKIAFNNLFNSLHDSGWLVRDGDQVHMHSMVQEAILYRIRAEHQFILLMFQLNWLAHRIHEGISGDFGQALRFLRYGESIIRKVRESDRESIYQPMLVLENEVLNVYTWINGETRLLERTKDLLDRATAYLGETSGLVGVMHNNLGMAYVDKGRFLEAEPILLRSAEILQKNPKDVDTQYLYTTCNLALLYVHVGNLEKFKEWFDRGMDFRKSRKLFNDPTFPFQCGMLGFAQQGFGNNEEAIRLLKIAVKAHHELPADRKNDLSLILYLNNLAFSYIVTGHEGKAQELLYDAVERLGKIAIRHNNKLIHILTKTVTGIIERGADRSHLEPLLEKLDKMKTEGVEGLD